MAWAKVAAESLLCADVKIDERRENLCRTLIYLGRGSYFMLVRFNLKSKH